ncbi:WD40 repeat domain-containing protein [Natronoflexus pectinivorans]|uniref:Pyrroloquinoline-quinone binding quinoprotein n=1 Tax=Natronoflexus pectinivorans TaxID=682526 RepID=A0A4R2GJ14_9BACT|nr:hypothetical protein [Natronoflexus pectinivorans]TCO08405.1 hypothetical protein EV194_105210 [Natronoflexus pectinivorans]
MKLIILALSILLLNSQLFILHSQNTALTQLPYINSNIYTFDILGNGKYLYFANENSIIQYDLINNVTVNIIDVHTGSPVVSILVHTNIILLGTKSGKLISVSKETGKTLFENDYRSGRVNALALTSDERYVISGLESGMVFKHSIEDLNLVDTIFQHEKAITSIDVSREKQLIAISSEDGSISLVSEPTYEWIKKYWFQMIG